MCVRGDPRRPRHLLLRHQRPPARRGQPRDRAQWPSGKEGSQIRGLLFLQLDISETLFHDVRQVLQQTQRQWTKRYCHQGTTYNTFYNA